jgi:hypothetical protein
VIISGVTPSYGSVTARFNMGAYYASADDQTVQDNPRSFAVVGYDILAALSDSVGDSYAVLQGASYLTSVENILLSRGYTQYYIDQAATASTLPAARQWVIDANVTWLTIINDLLGSIGYQGIWSDWDGRLHIQPYISPAQRAPEWQYDMGDFSIINPVRVQHRNLFNAPNRWVAVQSNRVSGAAPTEGDGVYTYINNLIGPSSVQARNGRTITKVFQVDAADQPSLVATAQITIDADINSNAKLDIITAPMPLHWHFDRMSYNDPVLGASLDVMSTSWKFSLNGADMAQSWTVLG